VLEDRAYYVCAIFCAAQIYVLLYGLQYMRMGSFWQGEPALPFLRFTNALAFGRF
jgi:hypothetical protein